MQTARSMRWRKRNCRSGEAGQAMLFFLLMLGIVLLGALCFAFDLSNMWFHRQAAQTAADAACTAGAMDLLVDANGGATGNQGFTVGTPFDCSSTGNPNSSVCQYALKNGYSGSGGNSVAVSFPTSVPGVPSSPNGIASAFIRVDVLDNVQTFFSGLLNGQTTQAVRAFSVCGLEVAAAPIPLLVLDPQNPTNKLSALNIQGTPTVAIVGGPQRSIQVNSDDPAAITVGGSALVDLSLGGPGNPGTGSDLGTWGGPTSAPSIPKNWNPGTTGHWLPQAPPISDPFAQLAAPSLPSAGTITLVASPTDGCQDTKNGCYEYTPGAYSTGICVGSSCKTFKSSNTAIFQPGIYYVTGGFVADPNSCMRQSTASGQGIGGTMFYLSGSGGVNVDANSGSKCPGSFSTTSGSGSLANGIKCTSTSTVPSNLPGTLTGNVLLAPCTGPYGDPIEAVGGTDPLGEQRGMLFFQDRSASGVSASWGGGGSFLLAGTMYFHHCNATGTGTSCGSAPTYYDAMFSLAGNSGSSTYVLGDIVTDNLTLGGTSGITMDLNPTSAFNILKATLLQ